MSKTPLVKMKTPLSPMECRFIDEYVMDFRPEKAAIRAGYDPVNAAAIAKKILAKEGANLRIELRLEERRTTFDVTVEKVIKELHCMAFRDPLEYFELDEDGTMLGTKDIDKLSPEARKAIAEVELVYSGSKKLQTVRTKYRLVDKMKAIENLGRYLGMWQDKVNLNINVLGMNDDELNSLIGEYAAQTGFSNIIEGEAEEIN